MLPGISALVGFHSGTVGGSGGGGGDGGGSEITGSFDVSAAPSPVSRTRSGSVTSAVSTVGVTATPAGGIAPYSYSWAFASGNSDIGAVSPSAATTAFSALLDPGDSIAATFTCTVTDSEGATGSVDVDATLTLVEI
jgi:hypothetical protein